MLINILLYLSAVHVSIIKSRDLYTAESFYRKTEKFYRKTEIYDRKMFFILMKNENILQKNVKI